MQGRKPDTFLNFRFDLFVNNDGFTERFSTVNYPVTDGVDVLPGINGSVLVVLQNIQGNFNRRPVIQYFVDVVVGPFPVFEAYFRTGHPDPLDLSLRDGLIRVLFDHCFRRSN
jgi:hypothetical protein